MSISLICRIFFYAALAVITFFAVVPQPATDVGLGWDKLNHSVAFLSLALLLDAGHSRLRLTRQWIILLGYGAGIELVQAFLPEREASLLDMVANMAGLALYTLFRPLVMRCFPSIDSQSSIIKAE